MNRMGTPVSGAVAIAHMILGITFPNSYVASCGARALFEESLTDFRRVWLTFSLKDRSRIILNCLDLWGMAAMGEIFRFDGGLCLMSSHLTILQKPYLTLSRASVRHARAASGFCADGWDPCVIAVCISCRVQFVPHSIGHPFFA